MSPLLVTVLGLVAATHALPQGYGSSGNLNVPSKTPAAPSQTPNLPAGCSIQYKTVNVIVEVEELTQKCEQKYRNQCELKTKRVCNPWQENVCNTLYKEQCETKYKTVCNPWEENVCNTLYKEQCETKYKDNCYEAYKDVQEPYTENVCVDQGQRRCTKHWQCADPNQSLPNCNDKVWVENQADCTVLVQTECNDVQNYRIVKQAYRKCDQVSWNDCKDVPYQDCNLVTHDGCQDQPWNDCNDVPYQKCDLVTHDGCQDQPWNHCQDVPYQHCEPVHKLVPQQTSQKKPFRVCDGNDKPYEFTQQEIADYDLIESVDYSVINARQGESDEDQVDVDTGLRTVEETTTKKPKGAITFG
jgi:hypothetical protein